MTTSRPVRVLHIIDGLAGGGSERLLLDTVRLSDPVRVTHRITTMYADGSREVGPFVYAEPLRAIGAWGGRSRTTASAHVPVVGIMRAAAIAQGGKLETLARAGWLTATVRLPGLARALRESVRFRPDVIHAHLYHGLVCGLALSRITGRPLVHTVPAMFGQMRDVPWMPRLYARSHGAVDRFLTDYPEELRSIGVPVERIWKMRGGLDRPSAEEAWSERDRHRAEIRAALGVTADTLLALSVGRLHSSKGHDLAAMAMALAAPRLTALHWVLLGEGAERGRLEALVRELGITERTHLVGFTPEVLRWYAAADLYLRTTLIEADNLSSHQAMALGLPVVGIASDVDTDLLPRVAHGIVVRRPDPALLANAMIEVLGMDDRGRALGLRGREYATRELGIGTMVAELAATYEELAAARTRR